MSCNNSNIVGEYSAIKEIYVDELGFYRHLDSDQRQYVCSNLISATALKTGQNGSGPESPPRLPSIHGDRGHEVCFTAIRQDLGISHFDKTVGYMDWKRDWDEFMSLKLMKQEPVTLNRALKTRVRSGIPHDYRCKVWSALIRMQTRSIRNQVGEDVYDVILRNQVAKLHVPEYVHQSGSAVDYNSNSLNLRSEGSRSSYFSPKQLRSKSHGESKSSNKTSKSTSQIKQAQGEACFRQIELDLLRTLPNNRHFENPNSRGIKRVRRILRAYACFNPDVGYCQGMNRLAATALLVLPEKEAFWCLVAIIQCIMPRDYYLKPWLAQVDCYVLSDLLEKRMPKLHKHLVKNDIQLTLFTWFFTIYVDGFRPELMLRIWDCFLLEGDKVLFRFALAILYIAQNDLLKMQDFSTMSQHLSRLVSTRKLDMEQLFETTFNIITPLSSSVLESGRQFHRNKLQATLDQ